VVSSMVLFDGVLNVLCSVRLQAKGSRSEVLFTSKKPLFDSYLVCAFRRLDQTSPSAKQ
jgi:hypothetical protein